MAKFIRSTEEIVREVLIDFPSTRDCDMKLVAIDCVADPSYPKAFVNGILESKQWVLVDDNKYEEVYENFEKSLQKLPKKDIDLFLRNRILSFIKSI